LLNCWAVRSESRLLLELDIQCWKGVHMQLVYAMLLPTILIFVLAPFFLILVCHYAKHEHFRKYFPLWTCGYNQAPWDLLFYLTKILLSSVSIVAKRSSFLAQLTNLLAVLIVIACVNVTAKNVYESQQHFTLTEVSIVVVALSVGFLSYFLAFAPGSRAARLRTFLCS